jgi:NAD(P)-dependent dehydrogenase (short-subunit alcohol dehydrogenase family)
MDGRCALVSGAGRGIGLGIAKALASAGCAVAIQDVEADVAEREAEALRRQGANAVALGGDLTDLAVAERLVDQALDRLGGLHVLVNNAAVQVEKHWTEQSLDEITRQVHGDFIAPILLTRRAVTVFRRQRWGRILNIGSIQHLKGNPKMLPYSMSKAALVNFTTGLARDLAADGITVNLLAPGYFNTWRNRNDFRTPEELVQKGKSYVPLGRIGEPADCGGLALLLCSDAGGHMSAQSIQGVGGLSVK